MFVSGEAGIMHADADAFFASVEQRDDPSLRGRPVAVGGGVVTAASYEARRYGVRGAMGGARARRLCPHLIVVPPRFDAYVAASKALFAVFEEAAPVVEGISLEEAFLDVRGLERVSGTPREIAIRLRRDVRERAGLPLTVGIASTKVLAKLASRVAKPDGLLVVPAGTEEEFLHPLPVELIWGVGPATARKLHAYGITTAGRAARLGEEHLTAILGQATGRYVHAVVHNRDHRRVRPGRRRSSVGSQSAGRHSRERLDAVLVGLADRIAYRMRKGGRTGRTVVLRLRFDDFSRATRSLTLREPTAATRTILAAARALLAAAMPTIESRGITLLGITVTNLDDGASQRQLAIPFEHPSVAHLDTALDVVRERFGRDAITLAAILGRGPRGGVVFEDAAP
jgi:DNA polymerase-4